MTSRHKTFRGKEFNMSAFVEKNADTRAVGNVPLNARGDVVDSKGQVKVPASKIAQAFSNANNKKVRQVSLKEDSDTAPVVNTPVAPDTKAEADPLPPPPPAPEPVATQTEPAGEDPANRIVTRREVRTPEGPAYEIEYADGSMEIVPIRT